MDSSESVSEQAASTEHVSSSDVKSTKNAKTDNDNNLQHAVAEEGIVINEKSNSQAAGSVNLISAKVSTHNSSSAAAESSEESANKKMSSGAASVNGSFPEAASTHQHVTESPAAVVERDAKQEGDEASILTAAPMNILDASTSCADAIAETDSVIVQLSSAAGQKNGSSKPNTAEASDINAKATETHQPQTTDDVATRSSENRISEASKAESDTLKVVNNISTSEASLASKTTNIASNVDQESREEVKVEVAVTQQVRESRTTNDEKRSTSEATKFSEETGDCQVSMQGDKCPTQSEVMDVPVEEEHTAAPTSATTDDTTNAGAKLGDKSVTAGSGDEPQSLVPIEGATHSSEDVEMTEVSGCVPVEQNGVACAAAADKSRQSGSCTAPCVEPSVVCSSTDSVNNQGPQTTGVRVESASSPSTPTRSSSRRPQNCSSSRVVSPSSGGGESGRRSRVTRSQNPDFAAKQKNFMKEYQRNLGNASPAASADTTSPSSSRSERHCSSAASGGSVEARTSETAASSDVLAGKRHRSDSEERSVVVVQEETAGDGDGESGGTAALNDNFCWICHREGKVVCCETCPRVYHLKCAQLSADPPGDWVCVECRRVVQADTAANRSPSMRQLSQQQFITLLGYAIGRLKGLPGAEPFSSPVDTQKFPHYRELVAYPMNLLIMEQNTNDGLYGSTEAFISDCKWIVHNCVLFNGANNKLTTLAKSLLRMCKWEMEEIETCPDCYGNAYNDDNWFTKACPHPHLLIWARLKGFPFWPAKAMKSRDGNVDCRFFGRHDRAWVPVKECFLYSKEPPCPPKNRSKSLDTCIAELEDHIRNLALRFGQYVYSRPRIQYDPKKVFQHLAAALPGLSAAVAKQTADEESAKRKRSSPPGSSSGNSEEVQSDELPDGKKARRCSSQNDQSSTCVSEQLVSEASHKTTDSAQPQQAANQPHSQSCQPGGGDVSSSSSLSTTVTTVSPATTTTSAVSADKQTVSKNSTMTAQSAVKTSIKQQQQKTSTAVVVPIKSPSAVKPVAAGGVSTARVAAVSGVSAGINGRSSSITPARANGMAVARASSQQHRPAASPSLAGARALVPRSSPATSLHQQQQQVLLATSATAHNAGMTGKTQLLGDGQFAIVGPQTLGPMMVIPGVAGASSSLLHATATSGAGLCAVNTLGAVSGGADVNSSSIMAESAGPVSAELDKQAKSLTDMMRSSLEKVLTDLAMAGSPQASVASLKLQLERLQWKHQMELAEQKKVSDAMLAEVRSSMEMDQKRALQRLSASFSVERRELQRQTELRVAETKRKQWCAHCGNEAIFYCCWNTSYCDFPCQEAQWPKHMATCANQQGQHAAGGGDGTASDSSR